ncbi:neurite extension and migration factor isoform X1 [Lepisosteus oculatus]|uniref:neurite extension and migration factor isoform X1 n=1 Tax=Lepisosteus oculatus TaxID=7918 RepID=UPI00371EF728
MDVLQDNNLVAQVEHPTQTNGVNENGSHDQGNNLKPYVPADAAVIFPSPATAANAQKGSPDCHRALPSLASKEPCVLSPPSPLRLTEAPEHSADDSSTHAISLTSCVTKGASPWSLPEDCDRTPFTIMEPGGMSSLTGDCLMQQSRTCLGCFIESKDGVDPEPGISLKIGDVNREYDSCSISDIGIQCMSTGESARYGDELLSDQLLSFPLHKSRTADKRDIEKSDSDSEDPTQKNYYEGLLLDKCNGEEALLSNPNQDWGYFESFISESKMELLDLCSKNELSVNLFSEEDVDNYMFDDDDSTLSSDVCSLKIRYESFQDNVREKTNALQEETQFNFFPSVLVNCTKKENGAIKKNMDTLQFKADEISLWGNEEKAELNKHGSTADGMQYMTPKRNYFFDSNNSTEDSGEYSDDSSCTGSSYDTFRDTKECNRFLSRENSSSSSQLNYGLRAKRKVRYSEDYLYDVDSIESERNAEKREKQPFGPKEEDDDDWCPKKRRKSSRKEPPVIIKYIIINRFKGEKHMLVKLGKIDPTHTTVNLNADLLHKYEKMAPLKGYWQKKQLDRRETRMQGDIKHHFHLNGSSRSFSASLPKRKYKIANRLRIQRIQTVEQSPNKQGPSSSDQKQEGGTKDDAALAGMPLTIAAPNRANRLDSNDITHATMVHSRSQEREDKGMGSKIVRIRKFKSEARLKSKRMKAMQEDCENITNVSGICPVLENQDSVGSMKDATIDSATNSPHLSENHTTDGVEKSTFVSATCSPDKPAPSVNVSTSVPVVPGGYLQTLLDASDSSSSTGISYFSPHPSGQYSVGISQADKQFTSLQLAQSCVLSPPSESELQQSPQNCTNQIEPNFTHMWHAQPTASQPPFASDIAETPIMASSFSGPVPMPMADNLPVSGYSQLNLDGNRLLYQKNYLHEQALQPDTDYQPCQVPCGEGHFQFQRGTLNTDNGRLISFDSVGSLSAASSNYSSLSLKSCDKDGEDEMNDNFLAHCSPKLVIQQSVDEIIPLKESTDLLDISNFTPDKFRHSSLSEMSPPDTPNLSPQVIGPEIKSVGKTKEFQDSNEAVLGSTQEMKWNCNIIQQQDPHSGPFVVNSHQFQFHTFNDDDTVSLVEKTPSLDTFDKQVNNSSSGPKAPKAKKKTTAKQSAGQNAGPDQKGTRKAKTPKASKTEKSKTPRQNSRSSKKGKNPSESKSGKGQAGGAKLPAKFRNNLIASAQSLKDTVVVQNTSSSVTGLSGDWPLVKEANASWAESTMAQNSNLLDDDQREFEEPSNILSNIASGMAEVQRFMMASIEPLWGPASGVCQPPESNSLKLKTLKILAGTPPDSKKKGGGTGCLGTTKSRKSAAKGASSKNQAKLNSSHSAFPQIALDCNAGPPRCLFDKGGPNLNNPGTNGPAHKKMYRHKSSAKFPRDENSKGKRGEREPNKDLSMMASFEKLRIWTPSISQTAFFSLTRVMRENYNFL